MHVYMYCTISLSTTLGVGAVCILFTLYIFYSSVYFIYFYLVFHFSLFTCTYSCPIITSSDLCTD